ncbi:ABC transporter permease [Acetobacterium woodii]|uniref:Putative ABC transport system permease protein n=1 Tax=Acetobacterium woodii (strain ATCC 29683 / DSM 1030 / JCM 2381 / KCTC 1655 / WB1) TaxID=931626 RepID=H6LHE6_ACEWD|nr:FtsX-like permease family protein [Acetobacterium woodii]AFA49656.1 putative ABC transport system permease protein [Acetobacterium woodii DSM 1030]
MIKVTNKKAIRNLAYKSFKNNKIRNYIAMIAIALTTVLFTTLFTLGMGTVESIQQATKRQAGGDGHAVVKYINDDEFNTIKEHPLIKEIAYDRILCDDIENQEFLKRRAEFWYDDDIGLKLGFIELASGHKPVAENEVIADTKTLQLMGVPLEVGAPLTLTLNIRGETVTRDFVLAGWWESDPVFNVGQIFASRAYVDAHLGELQNTYKEDNSMTGAIQAYIMFDNSLDLENKLATVITESGYSFDENAPNYLASNVNWSYLSTNFEMDAQTWIALIAALLLIVLTGYLIIYNIFQISVIRDIRFYGLLKTIGTTKKQIRVMIRNQALLLSVIGIPVGLIGGFVIGVALVPLVMSNTTYAGSAVSVSPNPWIFAGAALFALITVMISTFKPGKIAGSVSPVEAVNYTDSDKKNSATNKKSKDGAKIHRMARANLGRNKKRTLLVVLSLSLSLVLLNTVFTLSTGIDMNKFLSKFNDADFLIAHADYFQYEYFGNENQTTETFIEAVQTQPGFQQGGRLYGGRDELFTCTDNSVDIINTNEYGDHYAAVYGLEDFPLNRLVVLDGELDYDKLASGKYILEGVQLDDNNNPEFESSHYDVGEVVELHNYKGTSESFEEREYTTQQFTVLAHVAIKYYVNSDCTGWAYSFYLPANIYKTLVTKPAVMSYTYNVADADEATMERFVANYTDTVEPLMNYTSKLTSLASLSEMKMTVVMVGGALSLIIGLIGVLNFINAVVTSIITRRKEFAMLQSIGMTQKQLRNMLCYEGLYLTLGTGIVALFFGSLFSLVVVNFFSGLIWFLGYQFILWPLLSVLPFLLVMGIAIPWIADMATNNQSIVERLRDAD